MSGERPRRTPRWWITRVGLPVAVVAAVGGGIAAVAGGGGSSATAEGRTTGTASVERRDLVESESFSGTLGFGDTRPVASSGLSGTLTWIAGAGAVRTRNDILFMVDESPVLLMRGTVPAYRDMTSGDNGRDVLQLERNLAALGFDDDGEMNVDGTFDSDTTQAVIDWQESLGLEETGTVENGRVVFLPRDRRVSNVTATVGNRTGGVVMQTTSAQRTVTVDLDARQQDLMSLGGSATVELPDGSDAAARITSIGTVATAAAEGSAPTIPVGLTIGGSAGADLPDAAPVTVKVETDRADAVLAVPVNALLALAGGGFGLERIDAGGDTTVVSAEIGLSADGFVQVEGPNVREGMSVVVPE